jgi:hypothetical protein
MADSRTAPTPHRSQTYATAAQGRLSGWVLLIVVIVPAALYIGSGLLGGFLAADDFGWLSTARDQAWHYIFSFGNFDHFYRPVIRAWFFGAVRLCQHSTACYHSLNLSVHLINTLMFTALSVLITRDRTFSLLAGTIFAVSPGYVEAVAWVSAITELLSTLFLLTVLLLVVRAAQGSSAATWYAAALSALLALFAHEASGVLFAMVPFVLWLSGRVDALRSRHLWALVAVGAVFCFAVMLANHRNVIFTEGRYSVGSHMLRQGLDYLVTMYVGPHRWTGRLFVATAFVAILLRGPTMGRAGVIWIVLAILPFLGFTGGTASRYLYLPTMGFGWVVAALLIALQRRLIAVVPRRIAAGLVSALAVIVVARFSVFTSKAILSELESFAMYRDYAQMIAERQLDKSGTGEIVVPEPSDKRYDKASIPPMLRWTLKRPELTVIVEDERAP